MMYGARQPTTPPPHLLRWGDDWLATSDKHPCRSGHRRDATPPRLPTEIHRGVPRTPVCGSTPGSARLRPRHAAGVMVIESLGRSEGGAVACSCSVIARPGQARSKRLNQQLWIDEKSEREIRVSDLVPLAAVGRRCLGVGWNRFAVLSKDHLGIGERATVRWVVPLHDPTRIHG